MRTIKFRAIKDDMSDFRFVYGNLIYDHKGNPRIQEDANEPTFTTCVKGSECQFTGLTDKNGKEIYEGDKVRIRGGRKPKEKERPYYETEIIYKTNGFYLKENYSVFVDSAAVRHCEVIGNIYEQK